MKNEMDIVRDVSEKLAGLRLEFMLTGSMALNFYVQPRMTRDIDLVVDLTPEDIERMTSVFEKEYYVPRELAMDAARSRKQFNLIHMESVIKVDCIIRKDNEHARAEFDRRQAISVGGVATHIVSREDLMLAKLRWAKDSRSEVQLRDVRMLMQGEWDRVYVESWAAKLGLRELLRECERG